MAQHSYLFGLSFMQVQRTGWQWRVRKTPDQSAGQDSHSMVHIYLVYFRIIEQLMQGINTGRTERSPITLESGNVSLKNVGSHDKRVKKVLAEQRCVIITALETDKEAIKTHSELDNAHRHIS